MTKIINTDYTETKKIILTIFERFLVFKYLFEATIPHFFLFEGIEIMNFVITFTSSTHLRFK
ncbi:hypothetical protein AT05_11410 [Schleiferia thermophila str. Yellowstone]|jgi:hypothetical protein|uniref:Uncharacterized protein n=1 Tax=Schleiferia thermophila TaxID=884107 RepID=A0A368ZZD3_9FLAO|nr:hypothetical protein AT05_11410 [Schleiferia thermophila str. Yellowstone]RCX02315.1 hypothetical protein DES35_10474 [Schleiferia thermophila]GCD80800.1 hypothetical protein JCM30197_20470 [Schleiferia thermophila]